MTPPHLTGECATYRLGAKAPDGQILVSVDRDVNWSLRTPRAVRSAALDTGSAPQGHAAPGANILSSLGESTGRMREGPGRGRWNVVGAAGRRPARLGRGRFGAAAALAALGLAAAAAGFVSLAEAAARSVPPLRQATTSADAQRFTFDRTAWRAITLDQVFPPVYHTLAGDPMQGAARDYTRIGVAPAADCRAAFDPDLARLLSGHPCGPVLRVDYTDATRTIVATVGLAVLGTGPADELDVNAATAVPHADLRPRALAFPGTPAAGFGDAQRVAFHVLAESDAPILSFAAVGFSDGRPATADPGQEALDQSGAEGAATDLGNMAGARLEQALSDLWARRA